MARKSLPASRALMAAGIALTILGALLLVTPAAAGDAVIRLVALVLAVTGVAHMLQSLRAASALHKAVSIVLGAIVAGVGVLVWFNPELGSGFLTALLMIFFAVNGLWKIATSLRFRPRARWWWLLLSGPTVVAVFVGLDLLVTGIPMIALALGLGKSGANDDLDTINL